MLDVKKYVSPTPITPENAAKYVVGGNPDVTAALIQASFDAAKAIWLVIDEAKHQTSKKTLLSRLQEIVDERVEIIGVLANASDEEHYLWNEFQENYAPRSEDGDFNPPSPALS